LEAPKGLHLSDLIFITRFMLQTPIEILNLPVSFEQINMSPADCINGARQNGVQALLLNYTAMCHAVCEEIAGKPVTDVTIVQIEYIRPFF
jgi:hypothetical protein